MINYDTSSPGSGVTVGAGAPGGAAGSTGASAASGAGGGAASGGVSVSTEPGPKTHSRLLISRATLGHSGNYSCRASNTNPSTIHVFVSRGNKALWSNTEEIKATKTQPCLKTVIYDSKKNNPTRAHV
ncbi:hypothetical protein J437_LFUL012213 [Ladona fulva]|uniref:Ig-like domain-containing protein n=1 Tax=Ladona fulva TaxID=123851 RepID=A0A8K0NZR9_LADFU|nr:hypothetical protein J437_LFUL012213 [Ladona fulva]